MAAQLTVIQTTMECGGLDHFVLVDAHGPRGGLYEFTVSFDRRGGLKYATRTAPDTIFYPTLDAIPQAIAEAAMRGYRANRMP
jgi:hypothetical protein